MSKEKMDKQTEHNIRQMRKANPNALGNMVKHNDQKNMIVQDKKTGQKHITKEYYARRLAKEGKVNVIDVHKKTKK